jgi:pyruvate dehydrogenase E2 component (dihydrolipoamide acetyltransferase)
MPYEFRLPDLGEGLTEGEIGRWLVREGEHVAEDAPLVEIQTDKTTVEIPSPASGTVASILVAEGEVVPVGTVLVVIGDGVPARAEVRNVRATPRVRAIAREHGVDLAALTPTGRNGEVTEEDVRRALGPGDEPAAPAERRVPLRGVRRQISEHLTLAHREVPAVTFVEECDFTALADVRGERTYLPYVLQAVARMLPEFPELNARLDGDEVVLLERYDLGLAVQTDQGLVVPVVRGADRLSLDELAAECRRLSEGARVGRLRPDELRDSTFTVTSAGKLGGLFVTPLVNHPEVAILGLHRIASRAVVRHGGIHVREIGNISITFDHRVVDGARAAEFALAVIGRLESPE